jgi:cyclic pyranopterin phosphate synthase
MKKGKPTEKQRGKKQKPSSLVDADGAEPTLSVVGATAKVLSHLDKRGATRMVDVSNKKVTQREATAEAYVVMEPSTLALIQSGGLPKGDVLAVARVAGIMAAKNTSSLIPMCHPLQITGVTVDIAPAWDDHLRITATVKVRGKTGVEMEALTAASVASLTVYDMCKAVDKGMRIEGIRLLEKLGGRSGHWVAEKT